MSAAGKSTGARYATVPGLEIVPVTADRILLRTEAASLTLEGAAASLMAERILPLLDEARTAEDIAAATGVSSAALVPHLDGMAAIGVLIRFDGADDGSMETEHPLGPLFASLGLPPAQVARRLSAMRLVVFGLEGPGAHLLRELLRAGFGRLAVVDPFPLDRGDLPLDPMLGAEAVGRPRQEALAAAMRPMVGAQQVIECPLRAEARFDEAAVRSAAAGADLLICAFDRGFTAAHHWVNRAALAMGIPALFLAASGFGATVGPLVIPGETACFMCWRMREIAAAKDFEAAMAYEEHADAGHRPALARRPTLPALASLAAAMAAGEAVKLATAVGMHALAGRVAEHDALSGETAFHPVLFRPDCPACRKGRSFGRGGFDFSSLHGPAEGAGGEGNLLAAAPALVDERTGVVRRLEPVTKDPSEPEAPHIIRAELANMRFLASETPIACSGKGFTREAARVSALGEAVERYAGSLWLPEEVTRARRADLPGPALDPAKLVLFHESQYPGLRYAPWREEVEHGWTRASALGAGGEVFIPALAAYMAYETRRQEEFLFPISSNGLAAGPSQLEAVFRAALEVIERDAFLATWMHRLPCWHIDPATHPHPEVRAMVAAHERRGIRIELYRLPADTPVHVFMAAGYDHGRSDGPAVVVGLGAHPDAAQAARSAVLEVGQVRPALRVRLRDPAVRERMARLVADPSAVETLEDHDLRYAAREARQAFDFLRCRPLEPFDWASAARPPGGTSGALRQLVAALRAIGSDLLAVVLTTPDMLRVGLHVARVILPDFQPIHFGHAEARLGGRRLFELPRRLGLADRVLGLADLNPDPHPLA